MPPAKFSETGTENFTERRKIKIGIAEMPPAKFSAERRIKQNPRSNSAAGEFTNLFSFEERTKLVFRLK